ncbi:MAG: glycosyltransferase family 39 protein [Nanoarchaeota archaeon]
MNNPIKEHIRIIAIIILFTLSFYHYVNTNADLWWDSSVYLGIGKYIYSLGEEGLYEASRPLVWPLILGFFWKLGLDAIFFGRATVLILGIGTIICTYFIAYELFNKRTALLASFLLAFSPVFFLFSSIMFSEIPSAFFVMLGLYFFIKQKYNFAGLTFGIAFMARFFQIFLIAAIYLFFIHLVYKKKANTKQFFTSMIFFLIPIILFLILNFILFKNPLYPFILQAWMTKFTGWAFHQPISFYFVNSLKENILVMFSILGLFFILNREKGMKLIVPILFLLAFLPYNFHPHKEMRFLIFLLPLLYILTSYGIIKFLEYFGRYEKIAFYLLIIIGILHIAPQLRLNNYDDKLNVFYDFMENKDIKSGLWISNPSFIAYNDAKADELIYYPLYNTEKIKNLKEKINQAKYIMINSCDIMPCPPYEEACAREHEEFIALLIKNFKAELNEKRGNCNYYIFTS